MSETVPVVWVAARTSASILPMTGSIVEVKPLSAASASRSTVRLPYWKIPCCESGLMIVRVSPRMPGVSISS